MHTTTAPRRAQQRWVPVTVGARPSGTDRVGDRDRAAATSVLGRALGAGCLDVLEYEDRLEQTLGRAPGRT